MRDEIFAQYQEMRARIQFWIEQEGLIATWPDVRLQGDCVSSPSFSQITLSTYFLSSGS